VITRRWIALLATAALSHAASAQQPRRMTWKVDGVEREALVYGPAVPSASGKAPVIFAFHGHGGTMRSFERVAHFETAWPEAIVVYLQGLPIASSVDPGGVSSGWDTGPEALRERTNRDLDLVDTVLTAIKREFQIDESRVYASGFSNGALMAFLLWASRSASFAAVAPVAGIVRDWRPPVPRPVIYIGGTRDPLVTAAMQRETLASVLAIDGATGAGEPCGAGCTFHKSTTGTPVRSITHEGGHEYPPFATEAIVTFFKNLQLTK
jgi:polyhydroxybutyrate depolymerase